MDCDCPRKCNFHNILQFDLLYTCESLSVTSHTTVVSNFTKPSSVYCRLQLGNHVTVMMSIAVEWISPQQTSVLFHRKGLCYTRSLYLQRLQNQISESCQLSGQQAFWNLVHAHWHSGSQWLIIPFLMVHIFF